MVAEVGHRASLSAPAVSQFSASGAYFSASGAYFSASGAYFSASGTNSAPLAV